MLPRAVLHATFCGPVELRTFAALRSAHELSAEYHIQHRPRLGNAALIRGSPMRA